MKSKATLSKYGKIAAVFDVCGDIWTFGAIRKSKRWSLKFLKPQQKTLFIGVGTGEEAVLAAKMGVAVVMIDISAQMLNRAKERLKKVAIENVEIIQGDILDHHRAAYYDVLVVHYFLDVFDPATMQGLLNHIVQLLKPDGSILIAGYAPITSSRIKRFLLEIHHAVPVLALRLLVGNAVHTIYDYTLPLAKCGFVVKEKAFFGVLGLWLPMTHGLRAVRD